MTQEGKRRLDELLREAWATALGGGGDSVKQRIQHLLDLTQEETTHLWSDFSERVKRDSEELERRLEDRFRAAVTLLGNPLQAEVRALRSRAEELGRRLEKFTGRKQGSGSATEGGTGGASEDGGTEGGSAGGAAGPEDGDGNRTTANAGT